MIHRSLLLRLLALFGSIGLATGATAQTRQAEASTADVRLLKPLTFQKEADLDFGTIIPGTVNGTVTVRPDGTRQAAGGPTAAGGGFHPARFVTYGGPNQLVLITTTVGVVPLRRQGGGAPDIPLSFGGVPVRVFYWLNARGVYTFNMGGTITVAANQPTGRYEGRFQVTATYF